MKKKLLPMAGFLGVIMMGLAIACGTSGSVIEPTPAPDDHNGHNGDHQMITVVTTEFAFTPAAVTVETGKSVMFTLKNEGVIEHEWEVMAGDGTIHVHVQPGESKTVEFTLNTPGTYEIACNLPGHKEAGMVGTLIVNGPDLGDDVLPHGDHDHGDGHDGAEHGDHHEK